MVRREVGRHAVAGVEAGHLRRDAVGRGRVAEVALVEGYVPVQPALQPAVPEARQERRRDAAGVAEGGEGGALDVAVDHALGAEDLGEAEERGGRGQRR